MLNLKQDITSLTEFKRKTTQMLEHLRETGRPVVLTVNGRAELIVQDAEAYQILLDRIEAIEGIREGLRAVAEGRTRPLDEAFDSIRQRRRA